MRILTVAFFDDNFGDMLIRTCFLQLTKVALKNLGVSDYTPDVMPLKAPCDEQIEAADLIVFPGGGLFGLSYLDFAVHIERVLDIADVRGIPVVFSSLGINNMDATEENESRLSAILHRPCIRAMSVRESQAIFEHYAPERTYAITPVCDPAVWCGEVYAKDIAPIMEKKREPHPPVVGLNVVRGGLFKANGVDWTLTQEGEYLYELSRLLEEKGIDCRFFTNGSTWDVNTLKVFREKYQIPEEKLIYTDTTREVVRAEAGFDAVIAIRMHASIIAYALGVPSVNYVWNPKIPEFYQKIGYPDRAVLPQDWSAEKAAQMTELLLAEKDCRPDPEVQMTLYRFLFETYRGILGRAEAQMYDHGAVCACLSEMSVPAEEDETDLRTKLKRGENRYYALFKSDDRKRLEIRSLEKETAKLSKANEKLKKQLDDEKAARKKAEQERNTAQKELDRLNNKFIIRAYRKLRGTSKKTKSS